MIQKCKKRKCLILYKITKKQKWEYLCFVSQLLNQSKFRPVKHLKMTVWTSVLWKMNIHMAKKWPEMVVTLSLISIFHFRSDYTFRDFPTFTGHHQFNCLCLWNHSGHPQLIVVFSRRFDIYSSRNCVCIYQFNSC